MAREFLRSYKPLAQDDRFCFSTDGVNGSVTKGYVYVLTNKHNKVLYIGVTNDLRRRLIEHSQDLSAFTAKFKLRKLVYVEAFYKIADAIERERFIKGKTRQYKLDLINTMNPSWQDLSKDLP